MKKTSNVRWGFLFIAVGILFALNALGITNIDLFFDGWWTLFIIVPCLIGIFTEREKTGNIIGVLVGVIGMIGGFSVRTRVDFQSTTYAVSGEIRRLEVEIAAADFSIVEADAFSVDSNLSNLTVRAENGILRIIEKKSFGTNYNGAKLTLFVPAGFVFREADITTGAGLFSADAISAKEISLTLGAGEVRIGKLNADVSADIEGGVGKIVIAGGTLCNLDLEMGVGELSLTAALFGECELNYGVGEAVLTLLGTKEDYCITVEKGLGSITVDGETVSVHEAVYGKGANRIDIDGGIGALRVNFSEK